MIIEGKCGSCGTFMVLGDQVLVGRKKMGRLLDLVNAVKRNPCRHTADHDVCDTCDALKALEAADQ